MKAWMSVKDAAAQTPYNERTLRRCLSKPTVGYAGRPPLNGYQDPNGRWIIRKHDLTAWMDRCEQEGRR